MKLLIYMVAAFSMAPVFAETPEHYDCNLIVIADDLPDGVQAQKFKATGPLTTAHGGQEYQYTFGRYEVIVIANARWRGITWYRDSKVIAASITVSDEDLLGSKVVMVMNPENTDENVALECSPAAD